MNTNEIQGISPKFVLFRTVKLFFYYRKSELSWFRIVHFCLFKFLFGVEVSSSSFLLLQEVLLNADTLTLSQRFRPRQECNKDKNRAQSTRDLYSRDRFNKLGLVGYWRPKDSPCSVRLSFRNIRLRNVHLRPKIWYEND